ncbi:MAG: amylo-alpha-1,6-glucosidase [Acidobacteria bacterium]|nr:MAG: amylo-alpha-1,6-glucosidase [Acidobacteriota bacterium]
MSVTSGPDILPPPEPEDLFPVLAPPGTTAQQRRVLKHGDSFALLDAYGDMTPSEGGEEGFFHDGTRHLSAFLLRLGAERPLLLGSSITRDNTLLGVDLTNFDVRSDDRLLAPHGTLHVFRGVYLRSGVLYHRLRVRNHGQVPVRATLQVLFDADFADIFEVRGARRPQRGRHLKPVLQTGSAELAYRGLDGVLRRTVLTLTPPPQRLTAHEAHFELSLDPGAQTQLDLSVACDTGAERAPVVPYASGREAAEAELREAQIQWARLRASNDQFQAVLDRAGADLRLMVTETPDGPYPYAGIPWYSTAFGRDGIITALECLWLNPSLARGVLAFLAGRQARDIVPERDAQPGKILHETRRGEMAALREIPFGLYYGSVDSTPLFVLLAAAYYERTADLAFIESLWPAVDAALRWIDDYGDMDGDGFVEYHRQTPAGLVQQGWKDSHDSVFHADGRTALPAIALCEVQGYVHAAKRGAARIARALGKHAQAAALEDAAHTLQQRFEEAFWSEELGTYALALDGDKNACRVRTSNAGHCLFSGIADPGHARRVGASLMSDASFSGWGVRTVASSEVRYNPMSYHNGSIWPHDNALVAFGLSRYGLQREAMRILGGLFEAALFFDLHRLPELFCGFSRREGQQPTPYPVACAPQAWASGAMLLALQGCLGLNIDACQRTVLFSRPFLPEWLPELAIRELRVGEGLVGLAIRRHGDDVSVSVERRVGDVTVTTIR